MYGPSIRWYICQREIGCTVPTSASRPVLWNRRCKRNENKYSKKSFRALLSMITNKNRPTDQNLLESFRNYAKLSDYKLTLQ